MKFSIIYEAQTVETTARGRVRSFSRTSSSSAVLAEEVGFDVRLGGRAHRADRNTRI